MRGVVDLGLLADVDEASAAIAHRLEHPDDIVGVRLETEREVELPATALRP